ncbi:MAG: hypothetical protein QM773_02880 [Hyphomonadaceae bacterium]
MSDAMTATVAALREEANAEDTTDLEDRLQPIIDTFGWGAVREEIFKALEGSEQALWPVAAAVIWGAALDKRELDIDLAIALVYFRIDPGIPGEENNLAWSIASKLKGVGYLSSYDPYQDAAVRVHLDRLTDR